MKKTGKRFLGLLAVLCMVLGLFGAAVPITARAADSGQETQILPSSKAKKNCEGEQIGWGKINYPYLSALTMKVLPERYATTVMVKGSWLRAVTITKSTELKLYGLYEDRRGDVYRHVGVTYQKKDYYGYILEERITVTEKFVAEATPTPEPTATPVPTATPTPLPTATPTPVPTATSIPVPTNVPEPVYELVSEGYYDKNVIPDKFNTGCYDTTVLEKISRAGVVDGVAYSMGDNGNTVVIDLYYQKVNRESPKEMIIRNKDFSDKKFAIRHASMIDTEKVIRFENCVFKDVALDYSQDNAIYYFEDCSFRNIYGSNATFERCFFGGSGSDGLNPYQNVTVKDCYFGHYPQWNEAGVHTDAMQVYGKADVTAENITFTNCRIEIPILDRDSKRTINACFMVQLEFSDAKNMLYENCIINGGGYSIYARATRADWLMENVAFRNISIGSGHLFGDFYPDIDENIIFDNVHDTEKLYVASVWRDSEGKIHLSVSNDTAEDRTLMVVTKNGKQAFMIPSKNTSVEAGAKEYYDLAIDMEIVPTDAESDWVVCYDGAETQENQIRYVNWNGEAVYREVY